MNKYVADTMAIVLYLENRRLPHKARTMFNDASNGLAVIYFSAVSLMEIGYLAEKSRIDTSLSQAINLTRDSKSFIIHDLNHETILEAFRIKNIPELHDRLIAASSVVLNAGLITNDPVITRSGQVKVIW